MFTTTITIQACRIPFINFNVHISMGAADLETAKNWLQVAGTAEVSVDKAECEAFWFDELKNYFSGPNDPNYCVIIIKPSRIKLGAMGSMTPEVWAGRE